MNRINNGQRITSKSKKWMPLTVAALLTTATAQAINHPSMIIDTNDLPRIACGNGRILQYIRYDGSEWIVKNVAEVDLGRSVIYPSLAVDAQQRPHISYSNSKNANDANLAYACFDGVDWNNTVIEKTGSTHSFGRSGTSIAIDNGGAPHITYHYHRYGYDGKHAYLASGTWNTEVFDNSAGHYSSVACNSLGTICLAYHANNSDILYRTRSSGGSWSTQTVDTSPGTVWGSTKLIFDPVTDYPRIGYYSSDLLELRYAFYNGSSWSVSTVAGSLPSTSGNYGLTAMDLSSDGTPHFAYTDTTSNALIHAFHNGVAWQKQCVSRESIGHCAIGLTSEDTPIICHYNNVKGALEVLWRQGGNWESFYPQTLILSRETVDQDQNGQIDGIRITSNKNLNDDFSGLSATVEGRTVTGFTSGEAGDGTFYILFDENGTYDTGDMPALQITANTSLNAGDDLLSTDAAPVIPADAAPPVLTSCALAETTFSCVASEVITALFRCSNLVSGEWERVLPDPSSTMAQDTNAVSKALFYKVGE